MGFWRSAVVKAKKNHTCIYCSKNIRVGEVYSREVGTYDNDFNNYALCERCKEAVNLVSNATEFGLGNLLDDLCNSDVTCADCGSANITNSKLVGEEKEFMTFTCRNCKHENKISIAKEMLHLYLVKRG